MGVCQPSALGKKTAKRRKEEAGRPLLFLLHRERIFHAMKRMNKRENLPKFCLFFLKKPLKICFSFSNVLEYSLCKREVTE
jgi:hypothetical protein